MKTFIIISAVVFLVIILFQSFMSLAVNKTEEQNYSLILKEKDFEIRLYPSTVMATIQSKAKTYRELSGPGFRKLAGYIFGGNEDGTQIAMTSPVHMNLNDSLSSMSFVMPASFTTNSLPKPIDAGVQLITTEEDYVAVLRFGGFASDEELKKQSVKLLELLQEKEIPVVGNPRYLGYNPPYQVIARRNEIVVSIDWKQTAQ